MSSSAALVSFWLGLQLGHGWLWLGLGVWLCLHSTRMKICVANKVEPDGKLICFTTMDQPGSQPVSQPELGMPCRQPGSQVKSSQAGLGRGRRLVINFYLAALVLRPPLSLLLPRLHHMTVLQHARCLSELSCCSSITELGLLGAVRLWIPFRLSAFRCVVWVPRQRVCSIVHAPVYCLSVDISMHVSVCVYLCICIFMCIHMHIYIRMDFLLLQLRVCFGCALSGNMGA